MAAALPPSDSPPFGVPPPDSSNPSPPNAPPPSISGTPPSIPPPVDASPPSVPIAPPPVDLTPPPKPSAPPPVDSSPPPNPSAPPPVDPSPPPKPSAPPPVDPIPPPASNPPPSTPFVSPPLVPVTPQTPPPIASPPSVPGVSPPPPQTDPPKISPPSPTLSPPTTSSPPPPSSSPPPRSFPPPPSGDSPAISPPPPKVAPNPPAVFPLPPSPTFSPPRTPPSPPAPQPPRGPPSQPDTPPPPPPKDSPPSPRGVPPPSDPVSAPPPTVTPGTPPSPHVVQIPPSSSISPPGPSKTVPSPPNLPSNKSGVVQPPNGPSNSGLGFTKAIAIGVVSGIVILGLIGLIAFWMLKRKKQPSGANNGHVIPASMGSSPRSGSVLVKSEGGYGNSRSNFGGGSGTDTPNHGGYGNSRSWFTYRELSEATGGFSDDNLLGEGGFGCVYKGHLVDGRVVAVKQLKIGGGQGEREFKAEVEIISRIHHRHLVSLVGYCIWESKRLLVYDYVPNNTLHFHLHGEGKPVLDWATRLKIAVGAARGITYLHEDCHPRVIHRDIKSSNILIDNNYEAQVSDFGLAKLAMDADTHISTRVMGTFGYMAPEYATTGKLTDKSDVYSFGVVLLELITGRKPVDASQPLGEESLVEWARPLLSNAIDVGELEGLIDPRLGKNYIEIEVFHMTEAAAACVRHSSSKRPRMGQVVRALSAYDSGDLSNGLKVGESQLYNSAQQSADIRWFRRMAFGSQESSLDSSTQPTQNSSSSTNSKSNAYFSAQPVQGGNSMQFSQQAQNPNLSGQPEINVDIPEEHEPDVHIPRQTNQTAYHSTD